MRTFLQMYQGMALVWLVLNLAMLILSTIDALSLGSWQSAGYAIISLINIVLVTGIFFIS